MPENLMATMTLKNVPDDLYARLKERAERHRRILNSEAIHCLESALGSERVDPRSLLARARALRERSADLFVTERELRDARDAGRP